MYDRDRFFHPLERERLFERMRNVQPHESTSLPYFSQLLMIDGALSVGAGFALQALVG
jgi:hypothetical protein